MSSPPIATMTVCGLHLEFGPGAFQPQPETEALVAWVIENVAPSRGAVVVDLCAGCGTLALAIAAAFPHVEVHAVERSPEAYEWLLHNIATHEARVQPHLADAKDALLELDGVADLVVSNPPYVATQELPSLVGTVAEHDPEMAVDGGSDGLDVIRIVAGAAGRLIRPAGILVVEHSDRQGDSAPALLAGQGWINVADHRDYEGKARFVTATLTS